MGAICFREVTRKDVEKVVNDSRAYAIANNIKFPKRVSICGDSEGSGYVAFNSKPVKQLLIDTILKNGHTITGYY